MFIHERIQQKMAETGIKQADIARATGKSTAAVSKWINGENIPKAENLIIIASLLKTTPEWLLSGVDSRRPHDDSQLPTDDGFYNVKALDNNTKQTAIPVIGFVQAGKWKEAINHGVMDIYYSSTDLSAHAFVVFVQGRSMYPEFDEGDKLVIDPNIYPNPGDYVIAINGKHEVTFKKFRPRGLNDQNQEVFELVPINPDYPTLRSDREKIQIIGTVIESSKVHRRRKVVQ